MQSDGIPNSPLNWLMYLNPNAEIAPGVVVKSCSDWCPKGMNDPTNENIACGYEMAYGLAGYLLQGNNQDGERKELISFLRSFVGKEIVDFDTQQKGLESDGIDTFVEGIMELGTKLAAAATYFSDHSRTFTPNIVSSLPPEQRQATNKIYDINQRINQLSRSDDATGLIAEMQEALKHAIDVGLHDYGLIIRHSVAYGVGNYLRQKLPESPIAGHLEAVIH